MLVPWGPAGLAENRDRVTGVVSDAAEKHGFTFVDTTGLLTEDNTMEDRVHPTVWGNRNLRRRRCPRQRRRALLLLPDRAGRRQTLCMTPTGSGVKPGNTCAVEAPKRVVTTSLSTLR